MRHRGGVQGMGRLRSLAAPARPLRLGGIPSQSPFQGGCRGTECCPFFLQHLPPPVGACGERNYALFFSIRDVANPQHLRYLRKRAQIDQNRALFSLRRMRRSRNNAQKLRIGGPGAAQNGPCSDLPETGKPEQTSKDAQKLRTSIKNGPLSQLVKFDEC